MPKVKVISRNKEEFTRERSTDVQKVFRNVDPALHPFERAREYTRALNAVKLDKVFAKPFLGALDGHRDGVNTMTTLPTSLTTLISGACDGEIKSWKLNSKRCVWTAKAHNGFVRGLSSDGEGQHIVSCSEDRTCKLWKVDQQDKLDDQEEVVPLSTFMGENAFLSVDHHRAKPVFASSGSRVDLWDHTRTDPVHSFTWGVDSISHVKFNPVETDVLASAASDHSVVLYDTRNKTPLRKILLKMSANGLVWNPQEPFNFSVACEDAKAYTFDMRKLSHALCIHEDHVSAVMAIDYSPTGKELVTGSYDRSIRIFRVGEGHSREIYYTKRMQRIFCVKFSADNKYVLSGSDDTNIRLWRAQASERVNDLLPRERQTQNYNNKLKARFKHAPDIKRIARHQHVPKAILNAKKLNHVIKKSRHVKDSRRRAHSKPGKDPFVSAKLRSVYKQKE